MAPLKDPAILAKYLEALSEWNCTGYIQWDRLPIVWLRKNLDDCAEKTFGQIMFSHIQDGGEIDQVSETREDYRHLHRFHYDMRIPLAGRLVYVETRLIETKMGPIIKVVNLHDA